MLNFDEFRALNERERNKEKVKDQPDIDSNPENKTRKASSNFNLGDFLELHPVQISVMVVVIVDIFSALAEISVSSGRFAFIEEKYVVVCARALRLCCSFCLSLLAIEILSVLVAFKSSALTHYGYATDTIIIAFQLYFESTGSGIQWRLLNMFRFWRLVRLLNAMVDVERESHEATKFQLEDMIAEAAVKASEAQRISDDLQREKQARESVEEMLQSYKEEVDTLNEALKIAAMDIAEVANANDDDFLSEEDEGDDYVDEEDMEDGDMVSANSVTIGGASAGEEDSLKDALSSEGKGRGEDQLKKSTNKRTARDGRVVSPSSVAPTFVVQEDGTFERR